MQSIDFRLRTGMLSRKRLDKVQKKVRKQQAPILGVSWSGIAVPLNFLNLVKLHCHLKVFDQCTYTYTQSNQLES